MSRRLFPSSLEMADCKFPPFTRSTKSVWILPSRAPLHQTPIMMRLLLEIWKKNKTMGDGGRQFMSCMFGAEPHQFEPQLRLPLQKNCMVHVWYGSMVYQWYSSMVDACSMAYHTVAEMPHLYCSLYMYFIS